MATDRTAIIAALALVLLPAAAGADDERARVNYMLHCEGCHLADASGLDGEVPPMRDFVGYFLHSEQGREFLVRVPGVANAALSDEQLADLMNWMLRTFSAAELPESFMPYTAAEVATLRALPLSDPASERERILRNIDGVVAKGSDD